MRSNRICAWIMVLAVFFFILTAAVSLPIYIRPFYYLHIDALDLPRVSGFAADRIMEAYDEVLDYLTLPGREFGTGVMVCSQQAQDHFADCRVLFRLDAAVLLISGMIIVILLVLRRKGLVGDLRIGSRSAASVAALMILGLVTVVALAAATDFDQAFVVFHDLFFPGKDNWLFDWNEDQIIRVLPQVFFRNCAILIGSGVMIQSVGILICELLHRRKSQNQEKGE